jgi:hypothetical protein
MRATVTAAMLIGALGAPAAAMAMVPPNGATVAPGTAIDSPACEVGQSEYPNIPPVAGDRWEGWSTSATLRHAQYGQIDIIAVPDCAPIVVGDPGEYELTVSTGRRVEEFQLGRWMLVKDTSDDQIIRFTVAGAAACLRFSSVRDGAGRELSDAQLTTIGLPGRSLATGGVVKVPSGSQFGKGVEMHTDSGSVIRLRPGSQFKLGSGCRAGDEPDPGFNVTLRLVLGSIWAKIAPADSGGDFQVRTERVVAGPRGTTFSVSHRRGRQTTVRVFAGKVHMAPVGAPQRGVLLHRGQTGTSVG